MSKRPITRGERLIRMAALAAPLLGMVVTTHIEGGELMDMRLAFGITAVMFVVISRAKGEGMSGIKRRAVELFALVLACWAILVFTFPDGIWAFTYIMSFSVWAGLMLSMLVEIVSSGGKDE